MDSVLRNQFVLEEFSDVVARETLRPLYSHKNLLETQLERVEERIEEQEAELREKYGDDALP